MSNALKPLSGLDSELLTTEFRISDPLNSVEDLSRNRPSQDGTPEIIGFYDEKPAGGRIANADASFIWCCHCQKETHWRGYIIGDGTICRYTIGHNCGHDYYGASFDSVERMFNERLARKGVLRSFLRLAGKIDSLPNELDDLLHCPHFAVHQQKTDEMFRAGPKAFAALKNAVSRGGLKAVRKWRNTQAEEERSKKYQQAMQRYSALPSEERRQLRDDGLRPELDDEPVFVSESVDFGFVTGTGILGYQDPRQQARDVKQAVLQFQSISKKGTDNFSTKEIAAARRRLYESGSLLRSSLIDALFSETFFEVPNLDRISSWSDCFRNFTFERDGNNLLVSDDAKPFVKICPIQTGNIFHVQSLDAIHYTQIEDELIESGDAKFLDENDLASPVVV